MVIGFRRAGVVGALCSVVTMLALIAPGGATATSRGVTPLPQSLQPSSALPFAGPAGTSDPWANLVNPAPFADPGAELLEPDGTVLVHDDDTRFWWKLTPDANGSYIDGTWSQIASLPHGYEPLYFASAILPTGNGQPAGSLIIEGGEYNGPNSVWTTQGAIYNPQANTWTPVKPPDGWTTIGDAESNVLTDGQFMLANCCTKQDALLNPSTLTWSPTGTVGHVGINDEEAWSLLPSGQLFTVDAWEKTLTELSDTQLYTPSTGQWSSVGLTPNKLVDDAYELGPQVVEPDGQVFIIGATGTADTWNEATNSWTADPNLPTIGGRQYDIADGPASILPDGRILFAASPGLFTPPTHFFTWDGSSYQQVADAPDGLETPSYNWHMLVLPTGQLLVDDFNKVFVWTDSGTPPASWAPTIGSVPTTLAPGGTYSLSGNQLAGRSQGAAYGDDFQDNTNYPLVRITNTATGAVTYAPTSGETSLSIAPGAASSTNFTLPASTPAGAATLEVIADGIASAPVSVTVG